MNKRENDRLGASVIIGAIVGTIAAILLLAQLGRPQVSTLEMLGAALLCFSSIGVCAGFVAHTIQKIF